MVPPREGGGNMGELLGQYLEKIHHNGAEILYADYRGLVGEDFARTLRENGDLGMKIAEAGDHEQLRLTDLRDVVITQEALGALKETASRLAPHIKASAIVGVTGVRKHLLRIVNQVSGLGGRPFDDLEPAMDWLAKQANK
jgi:prephenate dehydrogenase